MFSEWEGEEVSRPATFSVSVHHPYHPGRDFRHTGITLKPGTSTVSKTKALPILSVSPPLLEAS